MEAHNPAPEVSVTALAAELMELEAEAFTIVELPELNQHAAKLVFMTLMIATVSADPELATRPPEPA